MGLLDAAVDKYPTILLRDVWCSSPETLEDFVAGPLCDFRSVMFRDVYFESVCKNTVEKWCHERQLAPSATTAS